MKSRYFAVTSLSTFVLATGSLASGSFALAQSESGSSGTTNPQSPPVTTINIPNGPRQLLDYRNAIPMEKTIPSSAVPIPASEPLNTGLTPGSIPGSAPTAPKPQDEQLVSPQSLSQPTSTGVEPQNAGTSNQPFTTARNPQITGYPYSPSGKLFFKIGSSTYLCSASVIQRGVVVTAAHCVANYGASQFYSNWQFVPAYNNGYAPYGTWTAASATILTSYYKGTDRCSTRGVVCDNDVAVLVMNPSSGKNVGDFSGWYGIAYNGFGYVPFLGSSLNQITQIGYPSSLDNGVIQERNDSLSYQSNAGSSQQIIGSLMTGGSSGGPWLLNYGQNPNVYSPNTLGLFWTTNPVVTGVTSWGYTDASPKQQGASLFTSANILTLYNVACTYTAKLACR